MRSFTSLCAIALAGAVISSAASAQEPASMAGCLHMSKQVNSALASNQQSPSYTQARDAQKVGQEFCASGMYARGVASYEQALSELGQSISKN